MAAPTIAASGLSTEINTITEDFDWGVYNTNNLSPKIMSLTFVPGAAGNKIVVRDGSVTGPVIFNAECVAEADTKVKYFFGARKRPYVDETSSTLHATAKLIIDLWPAKR